MTQFFYGFLIFLLFTLRPFVYKKAARVLTPNASSIFTAFWSVLVSIIFLPFFIDVTKSDFIPNIGLIGSIIKGFCIFQLIKNSQILNKESTSASVAWGPIVLALAALFNFIFLGEILSAQQLITIFVLFAIGLLFFFITEYKTLSIKARKAFFTILFVVIINIICDKFALNHISWYIHLFLTYISMLIFALISKIEKEDLVSCIKEKDTWIAGIIYALGEIIVIMAMQKIFNNVSVCIFIIRIAQAFDLILAYHIYKEGKISWQYLFAIIQIISFYFFFFKY